MARVTAWRAGIGGDLFERAAGQGGDRVEGDVAPELDPDFVADLGADRSPEAGGGERLGENGDALGPAAGRLAEGEAVAVLVADDAGGCDLGRRIDHGADRPLGADGVPDAAAGIDRLDAAALEGATGAVEIPPRNRRSAR